MYGKEGKSTRLRNSPMTIMGVLGPCKHSACKTKAKKKTGPKLCGQSKNESSEEPTNNTNRLPYRRQADVPKVVTGTSQLHQGSEESTILTLRRSDSRVFMACTTYPKTSLLHTRDFETCSYNWPCPFAKMQKPHAGFG